MQFSWDFGGTNEDGRRWGEGGIVSSVQGLLEMMKQHPENRKEKKMVIWEVWKDKVCPELPQLKQDHDHAFQVSPPFYQSGLICVLIR